MVKFYTYAPIDLNYPYILRHLEQKHQNDCIHEIVDIRISELLKNDHRHSDDKLKKWKSMDVDGWKVVPDCPDLFNEFNCENYKDSHVEYTKELHLEYYNPENSSLLPVVQCKLGDHNTLLEYCRWFKREFGIPYKLGVGGVSKKVNVKRNHELISLVRREFPYTWLHIFGLNLNQLRHVKGLINSFDTTAWTFPRVSGKPTCKDKEMCKKYFINYLNRIDHILKN